MRSFLSFVSLVFLLLASGAALAQTPLDWSDGGAIQMPSLDQEGDAYPVGTPMTCDVQVAGATLRVSSTAGATVALSGIPKGSSSTATADCEAPSLLPGVRGLSATASVLLRPWRAPRAPTLQP